MRARTRHLCASCSSSPFFVPPRTRPACARGGGARSLARLIARARCGVGDGGGGGDGLRRARCASASRTPASRDPCVTLAHAHVITAHRARHQRVPFARARSARACCGGGGARSLARSRARGVALAMAMAMAVAVAVTVGYTARYVRCTSRAHTRASSPRMARAINVSLPHARSARVRCGVVAALAQSLDHAHAVRGGGDGGGGGGRLHRASFVSCASHAPFISRACAASSPRVINVSLPSSPSRAIGTRALRRRWRSLARSIARAVWR